MTDQNTKVEEASNVEKDPMEVLRENNPNLRITTAPLSTELIREFFDNKDLFYLLNISKSRLKGAQFLTFTTNLDLPCDAFFEEGYSYEEYEQILLAYMNQNSITRITSLHVMAAQMLLVAKGIPFTESPYNIQVSEEYVERFIEAHKDQISRWLHFIDSTQVFALQCIPRLREHYKPLDTFDVVDDRAYVGANAAMLYTIPEFIGNYFRADAYRLSYFKQQFDEYIFKGAHLSRYFEHKNNLAAILFSHYAQGTFKPSEIDNMLFKIGVFCKDMGFEDYVFNPDYVKQPPKPPADIPPPPKPPVDGQAVQDGQSVVGESSAGDAVPPESES